MFREGSELSTGWWLCENSDGKRGIVPANRIQVMRRFDDGVSPLLPAYRPFHFTAIQFILDDPFSSSFFRAIVCSLQKFCLN